MRVEQNYMSHVSVAHGVMGWSWVYLSQPSRPTSADPSLAPAAVLLQMKLPASLLGPYSHMPTASGWGWPPPSVPPPIFWPLESIELSSRKRQGRLLAQAARTTLLTPTPIICRQVMSLYSGHAVPALGALGVQRERFLLTNKKSRLSQFSLGVQSATAHPGPGG